MATRAAVAEASSEADRARFLGYVGLSYGVGMAIGPALGGALSSVDLRLSAWVAAAGSLLSVGACVVPCLYAFAQTDAHNAGATASILLSVPAESRAARRRGAAAASESAAAPAGAASPRQLSVSDLARVARLPGVPSLLAVKALAGFATAVFHSAFPVFIGTRFALEARGAGLLLSYTGVLAIATQGGLIQWATARYDDARIVRACTAGMLVAFAALAGASSVAQLCVLLAPLVVFGTTLATVNTAQLTKAAPADLGTVVAIDMSVGSGVRCGWAPVLRDAHAQLLTCSCCVCSLLRFATRSILSPSVATFALSRMGYGSVGGIGAGTMALLALLMRLGAVDAAPGGARVPKRL